MALRRGRLAERRVAQGYSQEEFAEALAVAASTVIRWEGGRATPQPHQRPKIASLLGVTLSELEGLLVEEPPVETAVLPDTSTLLHGEDDDMKRRDVLGLLAVTGALVTLPGSDEAPRGHTAAALLVTGEELHRSLWQVFTLSDSKRAAFPAVRRQLDALTKGLAEARTSADRGRLCTMTADLYQLAGELFFDANRYTDAAQCYTLAANAAHAGGDHDLWACAMTRHAYVELYARRAPAAQPLLAVASRIAQRGDSALSTRHWVAAVQAQAYAAMGDIDACTRALDEAEKVHSLDGNFHNGGWLRFDGARLPEERGACYLQLGRPDLAEEGLTAALAQPLSLRRRAAVLSDLAVLGVHRGDVDQVVHYAETVLSLADRSNSGFIGKKLDGLRGRLAPLMSDGRVSDLDHRIAALSRSV
ncbi:helix-turn-helix domain-containing protein [Streptomyces sp. NBC_01142]|uniref:helix-turn-helix transcriptional regulator n=1 Tax=Streptomyces sp. NBC_01142 TaxID=2975865 RepID=UPI00225535DB|nr:helix-turn-helix domain-containing protein [Streptomyces sp. NBC_01142]MCX4822700.1 helix-turn-helix domain-containing protein [Streptomyces sp. NBC_01142]